MRVRSSFSSARERVFEGESEEGGKEEVEEEEAWLKGFGFAGARASQASGLGAPHGHLNMTCRCDNINDSGAI